LLLDKDAVVHDTTRLEVGMVDKGRTDEAFRHECEVKAVVRDWFRYGNEYTRTHLAKVKRHRGEAMASKLRLDALAAIREQIKNDRKPNA